jgi:hypothetical protein
MVQITPDQINGFSNPKVMGRAGVSTLAVINFAGNTQLYCGSGPICRWKRFATALWNDEFGQPAKNAVLMDCPRDKKVTSFSGSVQIAWR